MTIRDLTPTAALCLAALLVCLAVADQARALRNPFLGGADAPRAEANATSGVGAETQRTAPGRMAPALVPGGLLKQAVAWQLALRREMTRAALHMRADPFGRTLWLFLLAAFAYGMAHALGPGHGKAFAVAYFLDRPGPLWLGALFGNLSMFFHVLSAGLLVGAGTYVLHTAASALVDDAGRVLEGISYALLAVVGLGLLGARVLRQLRPAPSRDDGPAPRAGLRPLLLTALGAGLVPCPGAALVLLFCISLGVPLAGVLALLAISLGMGLTITAFATATIASRGLLQRLDRSGGRLWPALATGASLLGGGLMAGLGLLLFTGWWLAG